MAHLRRKYVEALGVSPLHKGTKKMIQKQLKQLCDDNPAYGNIQHVLNEINYLFHCESQYQKDGYTIEKIKKYRQKEQKPRIDELFKRLDAYESQYSMKSKMGVAIQYVKNQEKYIRGYLNDGAAEISNNREERAVKPFVIGRKSWLLTNTKSGAKMSSIYYSLIESAKLNDLDIHGYLEYVLEAINIQSLLPYSPKIPQQLKTK